jgi:hypothetical protein
MGYGYKSPPSLRDHFTTTQSSNDNNHSLHCTLLPPVRSCPPTPTPTPLTARARYVGITPHTHGMHSLMLSLRRRVLLCLGCARLGSGSMASSWCINIPLVRPPKQLSSSTLFAMLPAVFVVCCH